jgi:hypothetical protein
MRFGRALSWKLKLQTSIIASYTRLSVKERNLSAHLLIYRIYCPEMLKQWWNRLARQPAFDQSDKGFHSAHWDMRGHFAVRLVKSDLSQYCALSDSYLQPYARTKNKRTQWLTRLHKIRKRTSALRGNWFMLGHVTIVREMADSKMFNMDPKNNACLIRLCSFI